MFLLLLCVSVAFANVTIVDVLNDSRLTIVSSMIKEVNLTDILKGPGPLTMFAPIDRAVIHLDANVLPAMVANKAKFKNIMKYHIITENLRTADVLVNERLLTTLSNDKIRINYYSRGGYAVNGIEFNYKEHTASNGIVYFISDFLTPPIGTAIDVFNADPELTTLLTAVKAAGLGGFLIDENPITVFAPTNDAFNKLGSVLTQKIFADKNLLKTILTYHVIPGSLFSVAFHTISLHTFDPADKSHLVRNTIFGWDYSIDNARITAKDILASNGVVHKIADVLIPISTKVRVDALRPPTITKINNTL